MEIGRAIGEKRFETLLNGVSAAKHDQVLLDRDDWLVIPTLGAIMPGWLLAIPRECMLNFRDWAAAGGESITSVLAQIEAELGLNPEDIIWFEHGPANAGTEVGCGLDHAHLHILIQPSFSFDAFSDRARSDFGVEWHKTTVGECYSILADTETSYFAAGSGSRAICVSAVEKAGSQFFRRVVAALAGNLAEWNYRHFAHAHIEETTATFRRLERAASRER